MPGGEKWERRDSLAGRRDATRDGAQATGGSWQQLMMVHYRRKK
jgi:hypothetical protein